MTIHKIVGRTEYLFTLIPVYLYAPGELAYSSPRARAGGNKFCCLGYKLTFSRWAELTFFAVEVWGRERGYILQ